ncbi:hypothetical protein SU48_12145 [Deinococcus puniceus]|uniref:Uncharacterized protein n=1 Tax=Deinococcus puniceus TaxID=1182568 RepID=A0A172TBU2_9DEIO|nr:hypothetical protein SU48_12145 [Deinococcus puniceus]
MDGFPAFFWKAGHAVEAYGGGCGGETWDMPRSAQVAAIIVLFKAHDSKPPEGHRNSVRGAGHSTRPGIASEYPREPQGNVCFHFRKLIIVWAV